MARLRTIRAIALTGVLVSGGGVVLTSSGSSNALGNVIEITPTKSTTKSTEVRVGRGSYEFICTVGDQAELGMKGTLTVD